MSLSKKWFAWQLWFHYLLLVFLLYAFFEFIEKPLSWDYFFCLYLVLSLGDIAIHYVLGKLTGWKD